MKLTEQDLLAAAAHARPAGPTEEQVYKINLTNIAIAALPIAKEEVPSREGLGRLEHEGMIGRSAVAIAASILHYVEKTTAKEFK